MTKVVIANEWTDPAGNVHAGGETVEVRPSVARDLIHRGKAQPAPADSSKESLKPAVAEKEAKKNGN